MKRVKIVNMPLVQLHLEDLHRTLSYRAMDFASRLTESVICNVAELEKQYRYFRENSNRRLGFARVMNRLCSGRKSSPTRSRKWPIIWQPQKRLSRRNCRRSKMI